MIVHRLMLTIATGFALLAIPAAAQIESVAQPQASLDSAIAAPAAVPPAPTQARPTTRGPRGSNFPPLPPSRSCTAGDLRGIWKLFQLYEEPAGAETANYSAQPYQYYLFMPEGIYRKYTNTRDTPAIDKLRNEMLTQPGLQQYLVNDTGIVFFYKESVAIDSLACFIVVNPTNRFTAGQMLLMPPQGQSATRWVQVYQNIWMPTMPNPGRGRGRR